jgi:hypothetical protein
LHNPVQRLGRVFRYDRFMDGRESPNDESLRLELQEARVTFRHWTTQVNQTAGVLITGDAIVITYGFSQRLAGVLFLASGLPIVILLFYLRILSISAPVISLAIRFERKLMIGSDSLAATYTKIHFRPLTPEFASGESLSNEELLSLDRGFSPSWLWKEISIILYGATIIQIGLATLSLLVFHYRFM